MEEQFLTSGVVAKLLNVTETSLRKWHKNGKFTAHHVNPNTGYKYYTEEQVRQFLENRQQKTETRAILPVKTKTKRKIKEVTKETSSKTVQLKPKKRKSQEIKSKSKEFDLEKPLFKLYVDEGSGKTWVNYYAMRSGKTNALAFINNIKLFKRLTQFIDGTEIQTDDDKLQFDESMHNVNITIDNEDLDNINATIAKAVLWFQASFTHQLGHNNPTDEEIEKARFMTWNIDNFMLACSLKDRRKAIESMRRMLKILSNATIRWQEYVNVRDKEGNLVYSGTYKDKDGKKKPKIKQALQTYEGHFISTRTLKPIGGEFEYWINKEFATYLAHAGVIAVHEKIFQINAQKNANALTLAVKLNEYYFMNKGKPQANIIGVKNLLKAMPGIPSYSDLTTCVTVTKDNGQQQSYTKRGDKGGWRTRIQKPFEAALESLVDDNILIEWCYRENVDPNNYHDFENQYIYFVPNNI